MNAIIDLKIFITLQVYIEVYKNAPKISTALRQNLLDMPNLKDKKITFACQPFEFMFRSNTVHK